MIYHMATTSNLDRYRLTIEPKKLAERMVNEFRFIFSSITAENLKLGRVVAK